ncbi:MAG: hypothetical protein P8K14_05905, partial [Flavobacteriaceae bacterium]|nr:hypothetical protein [Flavobacteriaceae bacterium]
MNSKGYIKYFSLRNLIGSMLLMLSSFSVLYSQQPEVEVTVFSDLTDTDGNNIISATDVTLFTIKVKNTGNISLGNVALTSSFTGINGAPIILTNSITFVSASASSASGTLAVGETATYIVSYTFNATSIGYGGIRMNFNAIASSPGNSNNVSDTSDDGSDIDGNIINDPNVITAAASVTSMDATKSFQSHGDTDGDGIISVGDEIIYIIKVTNDGYQNLGIIMPDDTLEDGGGRALALTAPFTPPGPIFQNSDQASMSDAGLGNGTTTGTLLVGETIEYRGTYTLDQQSIDSGVLNNCLDVTARVVATNALVTERADNNNDGDGNSTNDCVQTTLTQVKTIEVTKIAVITDSNSNGGTPDVGDIINYTITVANRGNVTISSVTFVENFKDGAGNTLSLTTGPTYSSANYSGAATSTAGTLLVGETETYNATYQIAASAANTGAVSNSLTVIASSPGQSNNVSDTSDDGIDNDGDTTGDPTETNVTITKSLDATKRATVIDNGDGEVGAGDIIRYDITVRNDGQIQLFNITLTDNLRDGSGGSLNYDNNLIQNLSVSNPLPAGGVNTYVASYTIKTADVETALISNTLTVTGSSPGNTNDVTDVSDDGIDNDGDTTGDPTVTALTVQTGLEAVKTGVLVDNGDDLPGAGDTTVWTITVRNTGNITVNTLTISDTFKNGANTALSLDSGPTFVSSSLGSSSGTLRAGEVATYTATYTVDATDVSTTKVINQAIVSAVGVDSASTAVTDTSDNGYDYDGDTTGDPTEVYLNYQGKLEVIKTVSVNQADATKYQVGDVATYNITVQNTGNVSLTNVSLNDQLSGASGEILTLDSGPTFQSSSKGTAVGGLLVGEIATYTATFTINQAAVDYGGFNNAITGSGRDPANTLITDQSDEGNPSNGFDDPTPVVIPPEPSILAQKISVYTDNDSSTTLSLGDTINYTITVSNTGNVTLGRTGGVSGTFVMTDTFLSLSGVNTPTLSSGPTFAGANLGSAYGFLKPGEMATFNATYIVTQDIVNAGGVSNQVSVTAITPGGSYVSDISDDGISADGELFDDPTINGILPDPSITITKSQTITDNGNEVNDAGDNIVYTITISNTGNVDLTSVVVSDSLIGLAASTSITLTTSLTFVSATKGSNSNILKVGEMATYTAAYLVNQTAVDENGVRNTASVSAISTAGSGSSTTVSGTSNSVDFSITADPSIDVTKTASVTDNNGDGETGLGDTIIYTITITNTGVQTLKGFNLTDTLTDADGNALSLTTSLTSSDLMNLSPGASKTYSTTYVIEQSALDNGGVKNSVLVVASNLNATKFTNDVSDDGDDSDGNTVDDTTDVLITADPSIEVTKTFTNNDADGNNLISVGDTLTYTIKVENTGNITLRSIYLEDTFTDFDSNTVTPTIAPPAWVSSSAGSAVRTLISGEIATYTTSYTILSGDVASGGIKNTVTAKSYHYPEGNPVVLTQDVSDDGDDTDGNTTNDPTLAYIGQLPAMEVTKTASMTDNGASGSSVGDVVHFFISVKNTGPDILNNLTFVDTLKDARNTTKALTTSVTFVSATTSSTSSTIQVGGTVSFTTTFNIDQGSIDSGGLNNTITFEGNSARNPVTSEKDVKDISDDGDDTDGNTTDDPTFVLLGTDTDNDGKPDTTDIDDDNDGILDRDEKCLTYVLDGQSFESYWKPGAPVNPSEASLLPRPNTTTAPPFSAVDGNGEVWDAAFVNGVNWTPQQGTYFVELLQNAGANNRSWWPENQALSTVVTTAFDRIMVEQDVYPSSTYSITFYHKDGGRQSASHGNGGSTLVQIQSFQTNWQIDQLTETPSSWTAQTVTFTTDENTTSIAILFSPFSASNVSIQLDGIIMGSVTPCINDI